MHEPIAARSPNAGTHRASPPAHADGAVADHSRTVDRERLVVLANPDRHDADPALHVGAQHCTPREAA